MVVPINPIFTGRGRTPLEPQFFYTPAQQILYGQPFNQTDWPLPAGHQAQLQAQRPDYTWTAFWTPRFQFPPPDTTKVLRPHQKSLPDQPPTLLQTWTQSLFPPRLPLPVGDQVTDLAWPQRSPDQIQLHSWTAFYNLNLIGKDRLPTGDQIYDLTPSQRTPEQIQLHSWTWSYNLNLIGQDKLAVGKQVYDLTLSQRFSPIDQTWAYNQTIRVQPVVTRLPNNQYDWPLPQQPPRPDFTFVADWTPRFAFPPPDNTKIIRPHYRSLPDQPVTPLLQQSVFQAYPPLHVSANPINQFDWPNPRALQQPALSYTASYNLNLIGQDALPKGVQITDIPPRDFARLFQTWVSNISIALLGTPKNQFDWPTPRPYQQPALSFTASYNLNLIGQDALPKGAQISDLPPRDYQRLLQTWIQSVSLALTTTAPPGPLGVVANQYDWPTPRPYESDWRRSWTSSFNLNLIGQDQLPFRQRDWQNPVPVQWYRDWAINLLESTLSPTRPIAQFDWPVPTAFPRADQTFAAAYNKNLIGQDRLPNGEQITDLAPRDIARQLQTWITNVSLALTAPAPVGPLGVVANQYSWPNPSAPPLPQFMPPQDLTLRFPTPSPPVTGDLHQNPVFVTMGRLLTLQSLSTLPGNAIVAEDGKTGLVAEDGKTFLVRE